MVQLGSPALLSTFAAVPGSQAQERPEAVALTFQDRTTTFGEFERATNQIANALIRDHLGHGQRVAYLGKNSDHWAHVMFGAAKARTVLVSINWRLAPAEVSYILRDSGCKAIFVAPDFLPTVEKIRDETPLLSTIIVVERDCQGGEALNTWREGAETSDPDIEVSPDDTLCLQYTSGTTGRPKGAQLSHRNFIASYQMTAAASDFISLRPGQVHLVNLPQFHVSGPFWMYAALSQGAECLVVEDFRPDETLEIAGRRPVKTLTLVPAMVQMLLDAPAASDTDFSTLEYVAYGAAPMPPTLLRRALGVMNCKFVQAYGLTENSGMTALLPAEDHDPEGNQRMLSVGLPLPGVELAIHDDDGRDVPTGTIGEICVRSPGVMQGYWNHPEATSDALTNGWLRTGDAGLVDEDGYIYLKDRIKDVIVSGGENIYPAEVEHVLCSHPSVADVAVIGVPDKRWGEVPKAVLVVREGVDFDQAALAEWAEDRIARYKLPKSFDVVEALPRNAAGKVLRHQLRERYGEAART